jgi:hypothetical protein
MMRGEGGALVRFSQAHEGNFILPLAASRALLLFQDLRQRL